MTMNTILQGALWVAAGLAVFMFLRRRRARKTH